MRVVVLLIAFLSQLSLSNTFSPDCHAVNYNFHVLSLTWPNQFCNVAGTCDPNWHNLWDGKTLPVHGFWPSSTDLAYLTCQRQNKNSYDPYCYHPCSFNVSLFNDTEKGLMQHYWPQLGVHKDLWTHQWLKHGTCYMHITKDVIHSQMAEFEVFRTYFLGTIAKAKALNINLQPGQISSKQVLASKIGRKTTQFQAICQQGSHYLEEIRICYKISGQPGRETIINCPVFSSECSYPITVRSK